MNLPDAKAIVRDVVAELAGITGFGDDACPVGGLGLASIDGVQAAVCLESRLGIKIDNKLNPFVDDDRDRARNISEIAEWLLQLVKRKGGSSA